jgi:hypothetical protein
MYKIADVDDAELDVRIRSALIAIADGQVNVGREGGGTEVLAA